MLEVNNLETDVKKLYEGMFLIDSTEAAKDWEGILEFIKKMLTKVDAEIISIRKWDERGLAYPIKRVNRGTYILVYFKVDGQKISDIERDVQLSDRVMRVLILRAEHISEADAAKEPSAAREEIPDEQPAEAVTEAGETKQEPGEEPEKVESETADNITASQPAEE